MGGLLALVVAGGVAVSACSADPLASGDDQLVPTTVAAGEEPEPTTVAPTVASTVPDDGLSGRIAVGGNAGLQLLEPSGEPAAVLSSDAVTVSQPTWSRSGDRVVATVAAGASGVQTLVVADTGDDSVSTPVRRPYFFYSWSSDGSHIAALGPGLRGTSLDILDADGVPVSEVALDSGSLYLAWEPGGDDLLVHTDEDLFLVTDVADLGSLEPLGSPGEQFLAPAWIPDSRDALIVVQEVDGARLVRIEVDSARQMDLGPIDRAAGIVVSPDGTKALLAHSDAVSGGTTFASFMEVIPVADVTAPTELIDLVTGERTVISSSQSIWAEWSPDGSAIVLLQVSDSQLEWFLWSEGTLKGLGPFLPSPTFFQNYLLFGWQYVETPRVWSPDGRAIAYSAIENGLSGIYVHRLTDASPVRIADGDVAFWSPG